MIYFEPTDFGGKFPVVNILGISDSFEELEKEVLTNKDICECELPRHLWRGSSHRSVFNSANRKGLHIKKVSWEENDILTLEL